MRVHPLIEADSKPLASKLHLLPRAGHLTAMRTCCSPTCELDGSSDTVRERMMELLPHAPEVREVVLSGPWQAANMAATAPQLAAATQLTSVHFAYGNVDTVEILLLTQTTRMARLRLPHLIIRGPQVQRIGAQVQRIGQALMPCVGLTSLCLANAGLTGSPSVALAALGHSLQGLPALAHLDLSMCLIAASQALSLLQQLAGHARLTQLNLSHFPARHTMERSAAEPDASTAAIAKLRYLSVAGVELRGRAGVA
jgi:hypothetical protein